MRIASSVAAGVWVWLSASASGVALAQSADTSGKIQYSLFNPVPDDRMDEFTTDRPTKADVPFTVDAGHFQYETDLVNFTNQIGSSGHTDTLLAPNPTFKLGVTNTVDLELSVALISGVHAFSPATGASSTIWGVGDVYARAKINLWGNEASPTAFALFPYIKAPTAPPGIGNGAVEGGLIAPLAIELPYEFTLLINTEFDAFKDSVGDGRHANYANLVNLNHEVIKDVTLYVEFWSDYNNDPVQKTMQYSFDTALSWTVRPNLQLDIGANFGLNSATPNLQLYAGLSQRF